MKAIDDLLTGRSNPHLVKWQGNIRLHKEVIEPLTRLSDNACKVGIKLEIASGFRSFERQLGIWNAKARGEKPVLDDKGKPIPHGALDDEALMWAILRWSALPGASRHHWGTDMDIWDSAAVSDDYPLQLLAEEYSANGPFAKLDSWLGQQTETNLCGFFRPYDQDRGGVMPEPWHISYKPLATSFASQITPDKVATLLAKADICLKQAILGNITEVMDRFVLAC